MTYSGQSPILGMGRATASQIDAFMASVGKALASGYAPNGQYQAPPAGLGQAIIEECERYPAVINADLAAAQIADETAGWQSKYARERNNPGGIGAINANPDLALRFSSPAAGVRAHVAHLLSYVAGRGAWTYDDPRSGDIAAVGWLGVVHVLNDLNGRWAYPGTTYGQSIADLANRLLATPGGSVGSIPRPPMNIAHHSPNMDGYPEPRNIQLIVNHIADGTLDGTLSWFANPASEASSNFLIDTDGTIYYIVPLDHSPWTNNPLHNPDRSNPIIAHLADAGIDPNTVSVTIEHVGKKGDRLTAAQWDSTVWLQAWLCQECSLPADRTHIIGHYQIDSVNRAYCPGYSDAEWATLIQRIQTYGQAPAAQGSRSANGHALSGGFRAYYEWLESMLGGSEVLMLVGLPISDEYQALDGTTVQDFERARFEWRPGQRPQAFDVLLGRVNAELLAALDRIATLQAA
jgi:N-acetyl-anhydromuramyl-L-alanine amidase AmpD